MYRVTTDSWSTIADTHRYTWPCQCTFDLYVPLASSNPTDWKSAGIERQIRPTVVNHVIICDSKHLKYEDPKSAPKSCDWTWTSLLSWISKVKKPVISCHFMSFPTVVSFNSLGAKDTEVGDGTTSVVIIAAELHGPWVLSRWASHQMYCPHRQSTDLMTHLPGWNEPMSLWRTTSIQRHASQAQRFLVYQCAVCRCSQTLRFA